MSSPPSSRAPTSPATVRAQRFGVALFFVCLALAVAAAWLTRWTSDDAFISLRYARNLVEGHGLVFNVGERVEGYTNFLWTMMLAGGMALGLEPEALGHVLGIACFAATAWLLRASSRQQGHALPVAALAFLALPPARDFATSGLETSAFTLSITATVLLATEAKTRRRWALVGLVGALATMLRPDGALVLVVVGVAALLRSKTLAARGQAALALAAPAALLLLPWAAFKLHYYGDLLPNTFYAKSANRAWLGQGASYVGLFLLLCYPVGLALGLGLLRVARRRADGRLDLALAVALAYLGYVVWVGGDFMFARFCLPVTPLLLMSLDGAISGLATERRRLWSTLAIVTALLLAPLGGLAELPAGIADERSWYLPEDQRYARERGPEMAALLEGTDAMVALRGSQAILAYYGRWPRALEIHGLTDREIARAQLGTRGRPGHERIVTTAQLQARGVHFDLTYRQAETHIEPSRRVELAPGIVVRLLTYDAALMATLAERGARFTSRERALDDYLAAPSSDLEQRRADVERLERIYFRFVEDVPRRRGLAALLEPRL